ncbi:hypothetical protein CARN8_4280002 [mine drainage metagenome]|uniref:Uncharacterized protein n=1 Tax=mine drainage metagenome TaxID=410659 RepID=A0A3P3ZQA7_9ZZZZ
MWGALVNRWLVHHVNNEPPDGVVMRHRRVRVPPVFLWRHHHEHGDSCVDRIVANGLSGRIGGNAWMA